MSHILDSPNLRRLTRTQLQSLAKKETVRAVGKTEDIIRRLTQKHPGGVPVLQEEDNLSASVAPPKRITLKMSRKASCPRSPIPESSQNPVDTKGKGKIAINIVSPSASSSVGEVQELLDCKEEPVAGPSNAHPDSLPDSAADRPQVGHDPLSGKPPPILPPERPSHGPPNEDRDSPNAPSPHQKSYHCWQAEEEDEDDNKEKHQYIKGGPNHYMVVDALRQLAALANAIPTMETHIAETRCLLRRMEALLEKATPEARETAVTREYLETSVLAKMKKKRELWDGTGKMKKQDRKVRMKWLRAERKAENEKKWKAANEGRKRLGFSELPWSLFESQSDEEVIDSLQTTPTSSKNGSTKRAREDSADVELDADSGVGPSQKKKARS